MGIVIQDIRFALRMLRKNPGFAAVAVLTMALGIGANTAIFTIVNAVLLQPLAYPDSSRLVVMAEGRPGNPGGNATYLNYLDWQGQSRSFSRMGATMAYSQVFVGKDQPELLPVNYVSQGLLPTLGVEPFIGRGILTADDKPSATPVAVITYDFWQQHFNGDRRAIGSSVQLDQTSYQVVGILPAGFRFLFGSTPQVFLPLGLLSNTREKQDRAKHEDLFVVARLASGVTLEQAQSEMDTISARLAKAYPAIDYEKQCNVRSLYELTVGEIRPWLLVLLGAVTLVLLIACANVANLLLARAAGRKREMAIRLSLGAPRSRLFRQMLTESALFAFSGGALGILFASISLRVLLRAAPETLVRIDEIHISSTVLLFTFFTTVISGIAFGLAPALQSARSRGTLHREAVDLNSPSRQRARDILVISQLTISIVLLLGAGLLVRSFIRLVKQNPGFNPRNVIAADIHIPEHKYKAQQEMDRFYDSLLASLNGVPGIQSAAMTRPLPFSGEGWGYGFRLEGEPAPNPSDYHRALLHYVSPEYLQTMQVPLLSGRNFTNQDNDSSPPVALVNQGFASQLLGNDNPIGKRVRLGGARDLASEANPWFTIIGVVGSVKQYSLGDDERMEILVPFNQHQRYHVPITSRNIVIRADGNPYVAVQQLRTVAARLDSGQPVTDLVTMEQLISHSMSSDRTLMFLIATFAGLAVVLAAIGVYGLISYWVSQRTREIGIRIALGAGRRDIMGVVVGRAARLIAASIAVGLPLAFLSSRVLSGMLFGIGPHDGLTFFLAPLLLAGIAVMASYIPARRAAAVDAVVALRYE